MRIHTPKYNWQNYKFGTISLCMIMKNEAKLLPRCLNSVMGLVDEIIIVDTGSVDNSIEIAKSYGATVLRDPWQDDFARPRNIGIERARGDWILIMDPDELILKKHHNDVKWLTRAKNVVAFWITTYNYTGHTREPDFRFLKEGKDPLGLFRGYIPSTKTRFFKNGLGIRFEGCYHELVDYYLIRKKLAIGKTNIPIHHWAHEFNQKTFQEKKEFYLKLGEKKVREWPTHNQAHWELAVTEMIYGYRDRASKTIMKAIQLGMADSKQFFALARCQNLLGRIESATFAFEKGICKLYPNLTHIDASSKTLSALANVL
jgi:glycosyltransferase involved in cell wall biosynthesis